MIAVNSQPGGGREREREREKERERERERDAVVNFCVRGTPPWVSSK